MFRRSVVPSGRRWTCSNLGLVIVNRISGFNIQSQKGKLWIIGLNGGRKVEDVMNCTDSCISFI